jgi:opacity protein-like surface antigen
VFKLLVVILFWFSTVVSAETVVGPYIGAGMGYSYISHDTNRNATDNVGAAFNLYAGYSFNEYIGLDVGAAIMLYEAYIKNDAYSMQSTHSLITDLAIRLGVPLSNFANGYIRIGPGEMLGNKFISGGDNTGFYLGIGAKFKVSQSFGITVDDYGILMPRAREQDINVISVGIVYEF